jgi:hypothetical protein
MIAADSTIWKYLGPLCFHSWWSEKIPDSEFERIAGYAKAWNRPVWCSELGFDAMSWRTKGMNESWDYAFPFCQDFAPDDEICRGRSFDVLDLAKQLRNHVG